MRPPARSLPAAAGIAVALLPAATAAAAPAAATSPAATPAKKVTTTTKTYVGPAVEAHRWGPIQVAIVVRTTTTKIGTKTTVGRKIIKVTTPVSPDHADRSVAINRDAIPILVQETLAAQNARIDMVSRATDTSEAFIESLQGALTKAKLTAAASVASSASAAA